MRHREYYVYIMTNPSKTLCVGVTNDLECRVFEHKRHMVKGFTARYLIDRLVYYETTDDIGAAIGREKQIKGWRRYRKEALIRSKNPEWLDLAARWYW